MAAPYDIVGYTHRADIFCPDCIVQQIDNLVGGRVEERLDYLASEFGINREDERTFDSGDFPKVVFRDQLDEESIEHCSTCGKELDS